MTPRRQEERALLEAIRDLARFTHWECYHTFDSRHSEPGFPDVVLARPPRVIFAELKAPAESPTDDQTRWLAALEACPGVEAYLWRPDDWPSIVEILKRPVLRRVERVSS